MLALALATLPARAALAQEHAQEHAQERVQERVQERPSAFVDAATVVPGLIVEMRYAGSHNFVGRPIDGY